MFALVRLCRLDTCLKLIQSFLAQFPDFHCIQTRSAYIAATTDEEFARATGNIGAVTNTLDNAIDIHKKFYVELLNIHTDPMIGADSVREMTDVLKNNLRDELTKCFRPLLEQAKRADIQLEHARLDSFDCQRLRSRSRSRSRVGKGSCKDNGKGKDRGNDTEMCNSSSEGGRKGMDRCNVVDATSSLDSDDDTDDTDDDDEWPWLERDAKDCVRRYIARDTMSLVRACFKRGFGKGAGKKADDLTRP